MFKVQVLYEDKSFTPVSYTADAVKRDGDILIMNTCQDDKVTEVSYIHLSRTVIVSVTEINSEENENGT
jgi:hypothetical protein